MRKITLYQFKDTYISGDSSNIIDISKKIISDKVVLEEIEKDYSNDNEKYKEEYLSAKLNHLTNEHLYYWLVLKKYFEDAMFDEFKLSPDYNKEDMKEKGWMFPQSMMNIRISTAGYTESTEEVYIRFYDSYFDRLFCFNIGEKDSRIDRFYEQAIFNYKHNNYYSCAVSLFPIIESYHQYINNYNEDDFYRIKNNLTAVSDKMNKVNQIYNKKIEYYIKLVDQLNDLIGNHYFSISKSRTKEPEIINRNRIMHGLFTREISKKDCLQLFCVISNMLTIKNILDANEMYNKTGEEIKKLSN